MRTITLLKYLSIALTGAMFQAQADNFVGGDETSTNRVVPSSNFWTTLVAEPIALMGNDTSCVITGSADAVNPNTVNNDQYRFVLSPVPQPPVDTPCERSLAFDNGAVQTREEVSSTCTFRHLAAGNHTFYWLARKVNAGAANLIVADNSMSFVCMDRLHDIDGEGDGMPD